ncbi:hypothetical protein DEA8626_04052 [Defluviimonas aquaemixtae]|uniref:Uncharacterized protein n=1 Tax=Albidovulum aquaemixtae TaxID=1542388 RepID=A0A2R8BNT8_9RHOB|nr:hypothetical protein DEA8626_04052 [Defluviimonas aquaemixtae]
MIGRRIFLTAAAAWAGGATMGRAHSAAAPYVLPPEHLPETVPIRDVFQPFEIHVLPSQFALFWTLPGAQAVRYTVGVGRPGLYHEGEF